MRILCTGDAGFIAGHLSRTMRGMGFDVIGADIKRGEQEDVTRMTAKDLSGVDAIIHHAGQSSLAASRADPFADIHHNIVGTVNLLREGAKAGVKHFLFASTSAVYKDDGILYEYTPLAPRIPYGITKLASEFYIKQSGIPFTIFRYANVYGEGQTKVGESALMPHCIEHLLNGAPFTIHGDGTKSRDWIHVSDVVAANIAAVNHQIYGVYNIGTETSRSVNLICAWIASSCGMGGYQFIHDDDKPGEAQRTQLVSASFRNKANWQPMVLLEDGIHRTVKYYKEHNGSGKDNQNAL